LAHLAIRRNVGNVEMIHEHAASEGCPARLRGPLGCREPNPPRRPHSCRPAGQTEALNQMRARIGQRERIVLHRDTHSHRAVGLREERPHAKAAARQRQTVQHNLDRVRGRRVETEAQPSTRARLERLTIRVRQALQVTRAARRARQHGLVVRQGAVDELEHRTLAHLEHEAHVKGGDRSTHVEERPAMRLERRAREQQLASLEASVAPEACGGMACAKVDVQHGHGIGGCGVERRAADGRRVDEAREHHI